MLHQLRKPEPGLQILLEDTTPEMAEQALKNNGRNRRLSGKLVDKYARSMSLDRWDLNGETVKFDEGGRLLDGQHRMQAIIKANKTVPLLVARNVKSDCVKSIDSGRARTVGDVLNMSGHKNGATTASD